MQANKLPAPKEWADLTKPVYHGHVATSSPSRSGTTHLTYETILQGEGWDKGWNQILQIAGNSAAVTERSFGVPDGVSRTGSSASGSSSTSSGSRRRTRASRRSSPIPSVTAIVPANIARRRGREECRGGQALPAIHALRGRAAAAPRSEDLAAAGAAGHVREGARGLSESVRRHDPGQGELRLRPVRVALLRGLLALRPGHHLPPQGAAGGDQGDPGCGEAPRRTLEPAARGSEEARVDGRPSTPQQAQDKELLATFKAKKGDDAAIRRKTQVEEEWSSKAKANYARAAELASRGEMIVAIALAIAAFLVAFLVVPVASVVYTAFSSGAGGFTFGHFVSFFQISLMRESFWNSLYVAGLSVVFASLIAIPLAYFTVRYRFRGAAAIQTLGVLPLIMPPFVGAVAMQLIFGRSGSVNLLLQRRVRVHDPLHGGAQRRDLRREPALLPVHPAQPRRRPAEHRRRHGGVGAEPGRVGISPLPAHRLPARDARLRRRRFARIREGVRRPRHAARARHHQHARAPGLSAHHLHRARGSRSAT